MDNKKRRTWINMDISIVFEPLTLLKYPAYTLWGIYQFFVILGLLVLQTNLFYEIKRVG
jgi:hypothetical protein